MTDDGLWCWEMGHEDAPAVRRMFKRNEVYLGPFIWQEGRFEWICAGYRRGEPLGFLQHRTLDDGSVEIVSMAVERNLRRGGVGRVLVEGMPGRVIVLKTSVDNEASHAFYRALGFSATGVFTTGKGKKMTTFRKEREAEGSTPEPVDAAECPVHLEGMGVLGSLLALKLTRSGIPFTWNDTEPKTGNSYPVTAWRACTGGVLPGLGDRAFWRSLADAEMAPHRIASPPIISESRFWYASKNPPHGQKGDPLLVAHGLRLHPDPAVFVNVEAFVRRARDTFGRRQPSGPVAGQLRVVSHGFASAVGYLWGWSALARLDGPMVYDPAADEPARPAAFYLRPSRFVLLYAFPLPGSPDRWLLGTSMVAQRNAKELDAGKHYATWKRRFEELVGPGAKVAEVYATRQGWRPVGVADAALLFRDATPRLEGDALVLPPAAHGGLNNGPWIADAAVEKIRALLDGRTA